MSTLSPFEMGRAVSENVGGGLRSGFENNRIEKILQEVASSGDPAQMQNILNQVLPRISPEKQPMVAQAMQNRMNQINNEKSKKYMESQGIDPNMMGLGKDFVKQHMKQKADLQKEYVKGQVSFDNARKLEQFKQEPIKQKELESKQVAQEVFNDQSELIKAKSMGITGKLFPMNAIGSVREAKGRYKANNALFLEKLIPALNKGSLSEGHYAKIAEFLPKMDESEATKRGKLAALGRMMGLDISGLGEQYEKQANKYLNKMGADSVNSITKAYSYGRQQEGQPQQFTSQNIPENIAIKAWEQSGRDPQKARQLLIQQGYGQ